MEVMSNSLQTQKGPGTSFQVAVFVEFFDEFFAFVIWHKLANFLLQIVFTAQVV